MENQIQHSNLTLCAIKGIQELENCVTHSNVEQSLLELVRLRTSQIYNCEHCRELFTDDVQTSGHLQERVDALKNWRGSHLFNEREKAALEWTEAITASSRNTVANKVYNQVREQLEEQEMVALTMAVNLVEIWNRLSLATRTPEEENLVNTTNL